MDRPFLDQSNTIFEATMQFLYPSFLWALTAISIPIILHLFYFRRYKKVYFSNLRFLREVKEETSARNRLRNLLILLARIFAMAFIILAFAQPFIPANDAQQVGIRNVSLFIDNSFSMQSFGQELSLFDKGRQKATEIVRGYGPEDKFQVLGHELSPSQNLWISQEEALTRIEEMEFTPAVKPLSVIIGRQKQGFAREEGTSVSWIISDFQQSIMDVSEFDSSITTNLLPLKSVQEKNVAIDSAWFESPVQLLNQSSALLFSIRNYSPEEADNIRVTLQIDGQERPEGTLDVDGSSVKIDTANITVLQSGWHKLAIRISDFPVTFDDTYYLAFFVDQQLKILSINDPAPNPSISAVFSDPNEFFLDQAVANNLDYAKLPDYDLIILNELRSISTGLISVITKYVNDGGKVLFIPSAAGALEQYNALMRSMNAAPLQAYSQQERQVGRINTDAFVYNDVFIRTRPNMRLPKVKASFSQPGTGSRGQSLLAFRDGGDLISFYPIGKGAFTVMSSPLDQDVNDLSLQPEVFVPLLYRLAIYSSDFRQIAYTIGKDQLITMDETLLETTKGLMVAGPSEFIPGVSSLGSRVLLDVQGQVEQAGFYDVLQEGKPVAALAFNYDRKESNLTLTDTDDLPSGDYINVYADEEKRDFTALIEDTSQGKQLWKWCLILALLFIGFEIALIRLWKTG